MSRLLILRPEAEQDLAAACSWYEKKEPGLGERFLDEISHAMRQLEEDPERERFYFRKFRRILVRRFPYKIFYQDIGERVVVFRVLHSKQLHDRSLGEQ